VSSPATVWVPRDSAANSVGAGTVASLIRLEAETRGLGVVIKRNGSRGAYWLEPLVEVETETGRTAFGPVTPEDVPSLFEAGFPGADTDHPLALGPTEKIEWFAGQRRLTFGRCGLIDPLDLADYQAHGGLAGLKRAIEIGPEAIIEAVTESGLRGRGGAGFPTGVKWKTVAEQPAGDKYVACNADEGDSGTFADRMIMEGDPFALIEGMAIAGLSVGADTGFIYLRSEYPDALDVLQKAIAALEAAGWLGDDVGGTGKRFDVHIRRGAGAYICGEESSMLESIEGRRGEVRAKPPIPAIAGLFGKPTVVNNVLSLASVPVILEKGAATYNELGTGRSRGTQPFQLAGNVSRGGLLELPFGITIRELIEGFGGGTRSGRPFRAAQIGGPLGAWVDAEMLDLPMDYETLDANQALLGHGGVVVFDDSVDMAEMARFAFEFCALESCGKCTPCRIGSQRGVEAMERLIAGGDRAENLRAVEELCELLTETSLCAMGGLTPMPVKSAMRLFPEDFDRRNAS